MKDAVHSCLDSSLNCPQTPGWLGVEERSGRVGLAILGRSSGLTIACWSLATSIVLSTPAASATLTWRSPISAPWTGSCWAQPPRPARRPSGSAALPSRPPSFLPGTMSGSSSTQMPPALARPRASVSPTSEVTMAAGELGAPEGTQCTMWGSQDQSSTLHQPIPVRVSPSSPSTVVGPGLIILLPRGVFGAPQVH